MAHQLLVPNGMGHNTIGSILFLLVLGFGLAGCDIPPTISTPTPEASPSPDSTGGAPAQEQGNGPDAIEPADVPEAPPPVDVEADDTDILFDIYEQNVTSGIDHGDNDPEIHLVRNREQFHEYWTRLRGNFLDIPPVPDFDFEAHNLLAVHLALRRSGGYSVRVDRIRLEGNVIVVDVTETIPHIHCAVAPAFFVPYMIVTTPPFPGGATSTIGIHNTIIDESCIQPGP